jgi:glycerophosphoryl diester phosphodiesterase
VNVLVDPSARLVIAHRGASAHAPENTMEAFAHAVESGADAIELDVRLAGDDEVVVIHDADVDRTTDGHGRVSSMSVQELQGLDAGARFTSDGGRTHPYRARGVRVPTFASVLEAFPDTPLLVEVKEARAAAAAARLVEQRGAAKQVVLASELQAAMEIVRGTSIDSGASRPEVVQLLRGAIVGRWPSELSFRAMCIPWRVGLVPVPVSRLCRAAQGARVPTHVWTVNSKRLAARLWRSGANGIVTDDPAALLLVKPPAA